MASTSRLLCRVRSGAGGRRGRATRRRRMREGIRRREGVEEADRRLDVGGDPAVGEGGGRCHGGDSVGDTDEIEDRVVVVDDVVDVDDDAARRYEKPGTAYNVHRGKLPPKLHGGEGDGGRVAGIDLGTTNSAIAMPRVTAAAQASAKGGRMRREGVDVVADSAGRRTTPSVVSFARRELHEEVWGDFVYGAGRGNSCRVAVGEPASCRVAADPRNTFHSAKRFIGRTMDEVVRAAGTPGAGGRGGKTGSKSLRRDLKMKFDVSYGVSSSAVVSSLSRGDNDDDADDGRGGQPSAASDDDDVLLLCPALRNPQASEAACSSGDRGSALRAGGARVPFNATGSNTNGIIRPQDVGAYVIRKLLDDAESFVGGGATIDKAVITVPAYFNDKQMAATVEAGELAGLKVVKTIREPMAAALSYGLDGGDADQRVMVFDLGGGTLDVSVLEVGGGSVEVQSCGGDAFLGGDDFDERLCAWIGEGVCKANGARSGEWRSFPATQRRRLMEAAETAKRRLTEETDISVGISGLGSGMDAELRLTRGSFENICGDLLLRCRDPIEQACAQAGVDLEAMRFSAERLRARRGGRRASDRDVREWRKAQPISEIILVGGATRMPAIHRFVQNVTGIKPRWTVNPDEVVAEGAAVQAGIFQGDINKLYVMDHWQASLMRAFAAREIERRGHEESHM